MRFIPKKLVTEAAINPLDVHSESIPADAAYKQAILAIVGSEGNAYTEYDQVLALEKDVTDKNLVNIFHDMLIHFRDEEMGHASGIMSGIKQVPDMHDAYIAGEEEAKTGKDIEVNTEEDDNRSIEKESVKESIQEAVPNSRVYSSDTLIDFLANRLNVTDEEYDELLELIGSENRELQPQEVDAILSQLDLTPEQLADIENTISQLEDPVATRKNDFNDDISYDVNLIEDLLEKVSTVGAKEGLSELIAKLRGIEYDGSADTGWRTDQSILYGSKNPKKTIIS